MAIVHLEIEHDQHVEDLKISVCEPRSFEYNFSEGMKIMLDADITVSLDEFKNIIEWLRQKADFIESNFNKDGKPK